MFNLHSLQGCLVSTLNQHLQSAGEQGISLFVPSGII